MQMTAVGGRQAANLKQRNNIDNQLDAIITVY